MINSVSDALLQQAGIPRGTAANDPVNTAVTLANQGNLDAALDILDKVLRIAPNHPEAWFRIGEIQVARGNFKPSAQAFQRVIKLAPQMEEGYVHLGNVYLRNGRLSQALQTYRDGLRNVPNSALLHFNLGIALKQGGDLTAAIERFKKALTLQPDYAQAFFSLGNSYREAGRNVEAEETYKQAIRLQPENPDYRANLGAFHAARKNYTAATEECLAALKVAPQHVHALRNLSLSLYHLGAYEQGADVAMQALAVTPQDTMLQYHMGEMLYGLMRQGKAEKARIHAEAWRQQFPDHAVAQHMAAAVLGGNIPARASDDYVRETFDRFSSDFETTLSNLGYRVPEMLCDAVVDALGSRTGLTVLDAGCGTGLCAPFLKPISAKLAGVDLSGGMLAKARERNLYDTLHQAELGAFLNGTLDRYDVTVAADVFCYFGALDDTFRSIADRSAPQSLLAFTVEEAKDGAAADTGYRLGPTGRYQHDAGYIRRALEQAGYGILRFEETHGREEMGQPVPCLLVLAQRA